MLLRVYAHVHMCVGDRVREPFVAGHMPAPSQTHPLSHAVPQWTLPQQGTVHASSQNLSACDAEVIFLLGSQGSKWETSARGFLTVEDTGLQKP